MMSIPEDTIQINGHSFILATLPDLIFSSMEGRNGAIRISYYFLVGGPFNEASYWHPFSMAPCGLEPFIAHLSDQYLQELSSTFCQMDERFWQQMQQWAVALTRFYGYELPPPIPTNPWLTGAELSIRLTELTETAYRKIARKRRSYKVDQTPDWMLQPEFQALALQVEEVVQTSQALTAQIIEYRKKAYPHYPSPEELGDQRAKGLIDRANEQPGISAQQRIKLLQKALRFGKTGIQASKAYMRLAMWYEDLGDVSKAIEHYLLSMKVWKEYPYAYFVCAKLYYGQKRYAEAFNSIKKALEFSINDWGEREDFKEAKKLLISLETLTQDISSHLPGETTG